MISQSKALMINDANVGVVSLFGKLTVALDLSSGQILWTGEALGQPVALTTRHLVVIENVPNPHIVIRSLETGAVLTKTEGREFPAQSDDSVYQTEAQSFRARDESEGVTIEWVLQDKYLGGAAPGAFDPPRRQAGSTRVKLTDGEFQAAGATDTPNLPKEIEEDVFVADTERLAGELQRMRVRDTYYVLSVATSAIGEQVAKVTALKAVTGEVKWQTEAGRTEATSRPGPLRR